jgi:hypothetical protein
MRFEIESGDGYAFEFGFGVYGCEYGVLFIWERER